MKRKSPIRDRDRPAYDSVLKLNVVALQIKKAKSSLTAAKLSDDCWLVILCGHCNAVMIRTLGNKTSY